MKKLNKTTDIQKYLQSGNLTQQFLDDDFVLDKVMCDYNARLKSKGQANKLESLILWICKQVEYSKDEAFRKKYKFQRTAEEIWNSGFTTGCTDYCILFATFARQICIPTTCLHTAEKTWLSKLKNNEDFKGNLGHGFCECFYDGEWLLVDPTCKRISRNYNVKCLNLNYKVGDSHQFIPYYRGLDLEIKQTISEHNKVMNDLCLNL